MPDLYDGFEIEAFEVGHGQWRARIKRANSTPAGLDGVLFPAMELDFASPDRDAAIAHAKNHIDRFRLRYDTAA